MMYFTGKLNDCELVFSMFIDEKVTMIIDLISYNYDEIIKTIRKIKTIIKGCLNREPEEYRYDFSLISIMDFDEVIDVFEKLIEHGLKLDPKTEEMIFSSFSEQIMF